MADALVGELLLALVGHCGDVFESARGAREEEREVLGLLPHPDYCNIRLSHDLAWVETPDREQLNQLVHLGYHTQALRQFIEHEHCNIGISAARGGARAGSIYRHALATGLQEVVDVYQAAVLQLQLYVLGQQQGGVSSSSSSSSGPVLAKLNHHLNDFQLLLPQLHRLVFQVSGSDRGVPDAWPAPGVQAPGPPTDSADAPGPAASGLHAMGGAQLMGLLQAAARCGVPIIQSCMQRLVWHCNQVLFKQLTSWMVHGKLVDPYGEFFIRPSLLQQQHLQQQQEWVGAVGGGGGGALDALDWHNSYLVHEPSVPAHISLAAAESAAFIGKAVLLLKNPAGAFRGAELLQYRDTLEFTQALRVLQAAPLLDRMAFERTVEAIRAKVAALLWQLVVVQADLMSHLAAIKDYFLMAKGELYHSFLVDARKVLAAPPRPLIADSDVGIAFQQAALKSTAQHDALFPRFRIHWAPQLRPAQDPAQRLTTPPPLPSPANGFALPNVEVPRFDANWDSIWLEYQGEWPLGLLITPQVLGRYNALFQLLLRLKRVQLRLEEAWQALGALGHWQERRSAGGRRGGRAEHAASTRTLQDLRQLRHHMSHLISNLQIYIQVDVIESNFAQLEAHIAAAQDFSEVERAHANYLHALMQQSFLNTTTICRTISALFQHVHELCQLVDAARTHAAAASLADELGPSSARPGTNQPQQGGLLTEAEALRLHTTRTNFSQRMTELYTFLHSTRLQDLNKAPHLRQFYLRLNFNEYVSQKIVISSKIAAPSALFARPPPSPLTPASGAHHAGGTGGATPERPASAVAALLAARQAR